MTRIARPTATAARLFPRRGVRGLDAQRPPPGAALARLPAASFARALVVPGAHPGPGREVIGAGEARHIGPDLGDQRLGDVPADAGDRVQVGDGRLVLAY